jgi:hypothetical protein
MNERNQELETLQDIKRIMERSSRFISLSGLSGIAAGVFALGGAYLAYDWIFEYYVNYNGRGFFSVIEFNRLKISLVFLAMVVLVLALGSSFYFTWRKAKQDNLPLWDHASRKLLINMVLPLVSGGLFILAMLQHNIWMFVAPACLVFYGIALVNGSKYTLSDVRYLGICQIILGLINTQFIGYGLYFWAFGFGVLHIVYGIMMWLKYEK